MEGVCENINTSLHYNQFYEWISDKVLPFLNQAFLAYLTDDEVIKPALKFYSSLAYSKNSRIRFPLVSASGIILFK